MADENLVPKNYTEPAGPIEEKKTVIPAPLAAPKKEIQINYPPLRWTETQDLIGKIEKQVGGRVLTYYVGGDAAIAEDQIRYFYSHLKTLGKTKQLHVVLFSYGGSPQVALRLGYLLRSFCTKLVFIIPEIAASAATMIALSGDKIIMTPSASLSAIDSGLTHPLNPRSADGRPVSISVDQINRAVKLLREDLGPGHVQSEKLPYEILFQYLHPAVIGEIKRNESLSKKIASELLSLHEKDQDKIQKIVAAIHDNYPAHNYPIVAAKAKELGLNAEEADEELTDLAWKLVGNYVLVTKEAITYTDGATLNREATPVAIETIGRRSVPRLHSLKKFDGKNWNTFDSRLSWQFLTMKPVGEESKLVWSEFEV